jgi:thiamine pyrophosphokinase
MKAGEKLLCTKVSPPRPLFKKLWKKKKWSCADATARRRKKSIAAVQKINRGGYFIDHPLQRRPSFFLFAPKVL